MDTGIHATELWCAACRMHVTYRKINFMENGYRDWRLEIRCGCGELQDPGLRGLVREIYDRQVGVEILAMQEDTLSMRLGSAENAWLNRQVEAQNAERETEKRSGDPHPLQVLRT